MKEKPLIIIAAVREEVSKIIEQVEYTVISSVGRREIISGYLKEMPVRVLITGPGIVNTVQSLSAAVENQMPSLIIQTGCAGAFKESGLQIGDIAIAAEENDVHLGIEPENRSGKLDELPFSVIERENLKIKNRYPLDQKYVNSVFDILKPAFDKKQIQVKKGHFVTVSTITATDKRAEELFEVFGAYMESMEGSGAAHVAIHYDIPFLEIRAASNFVGKRDKNKWNLPLAFERCAEAVLMLVGSSL